MRARIKEGAAGLGALFSRFKTGRWYAAEWVGAENGAVRLLNGKASSEWPREKVDVRPAPDDEWELREVLRTTESRAGQALEYPTRMAECPEGHKRALPTRFRGDVVQLTCKECGRAYRLRAE